MTFNETGKVTGVKGFTYEIPSSGNASVFSASVKENANVWFRRYNNAAAFDASEQEYGSAASFAGQDTPTVTPNTAAFDNMTGEKFAVAQRVNDFQTKNIPIDGDNPQGVSYIGDNIYICDATSGTVYNYDTSGNLQGQFSTSVSPIGMTWDGKYFWLSNNNNAIYRYSAAGVEQSSFVVNGQPRGLAWTGSYLWNVQNQRGVYRLKTDGTEVGGFGRPAFGMNGMGYDGKYLYIGGAGPDHIYKFNKSGVNKGSVVNFSNTSADWTGSYLLTVDNNSNTVYWYTGPNSLDISYQIGGIS